MPRPRKDDIQKRSCRHQTWPFLLLTPCPSSYLLIFYILIFQLITLLQIDFIIVFNRQGKVTSSFFSEPFSFFF